MIQQAISTAMEGNSLTESEAMQVMSEIMEGSATSAQIGAFLVAFRLKGETIEEVTGFARVMRAKAIRIHSSRYPLVDTCGTGGDGKHTFNISTAAALVAAAGGACIAKHGGRASSSRTGSADVLTALGVNIENSPEQVSACIEEIGIGFMFAPLLHTAMRFASGPRREIGIRTVLNLLGPLTNPAGATAQVMGVYSPEVIQTAAHVLNNLGTKRAFVVHSSDGMDEITTTGVTHIAEVRAGQVVTYDIEGRDFDFPETSTDDLRGGDAQENAIIIKAILKGVRGPHRDIVVLNAAAALVAGEISDNWEDGLSVAIEAIDSGAAEQKLNALIRLTNTE